MVVTKKRGDLTYSDPAPFNFWRLTPAAAKTLAVRARLDIIYNPAIDYVVVVGCLHRGLEVNKLDKPLVFTDQRSTI